MRARAVVLLALAAAAVGGVAVLFVGRTAGWLEGGPRTVVLQEPAPGVAVAAAVRSPLGETFDPARLYAERSPGVVTIYALFGANTAASAAQGSGFVVSADGLVLTNSHVITTAGQGSGAVRPARDVYVEFQDHDRIPARVVGWDVFDDVGVLRVDPQAHALVPLPLGDSSRVVVGEPVAAIGSPFGNENSLAVGVVSATHRSIDSLTSQYDLVDAIQTDAAINHGSSGGPLFDAEGRVIGLTAQMLGDTGTSDGVGFAVPIDAARRSLDQLLATGTVAYAYVGITTEDLTPAIAARLDYPVRYGAVIASVRPGSPGERAGLRGGSQPRAVNGEAFTYGGDVVVAIDGRPVGSSADVVRAVTERLRPGEVATFTTYRSGHRRLVKVQVADRPRIPTG